VDLNPVILAIPMYFILMAVEIIYERIKNKQSYRVNDAVTNISTGTLQQLTNTFISLFKIGIYTLVYHTASFFELPQNSWTFLLALAFWDLCYYWEHRMAHTINLFWGGHIVHHQSEEYNLSVALRQTSTGFIWGFPFFLPMAFLGIHPIQFVLVGGINLLYQFWIHTEHIDKLPRWFEWLFNTPSHHRVHHGRDPKYIDKNYAGIFIIWDRFFGTFKEEEERPHYGITTPLMSWNPVFANFSHYINLGKWLKQVKSPVDGIKLLFNKPGWFPPYMGGYQSPKKVPDDYHKYDRKIDRIQWYILFQFLLALVINSFYFFKHAEFALTEKSIFAAWIVFSTLIFGFMFEHQKRLVVILELIRLACIPYILSTIILEAWIEQNKWMHSLGLALALFSALFFLRACYRKENKTTQAVDQR
jgi:alkylglycerol monooxygenase